MNKTILRTYLCSEYIFDQILKNSSNRVVKVKNIDNYYKGYTNKKTIMYDGSEYLICQEHLLNYYADIEDCTDWKQCVIRKCERLTGLQVEKDVDGPTAYKWVNNMLLKYYTNEEIQNRLDLFSSEYVDKLKQLHYNYIDDDNCISLHKNCAKYDINGAHNDALREIFPKAATEIEYYYNQRHEKPMIKKYFNYYVGMLCKKGHRGTYNWIVQRTTCKLLNAIKETDGELVYANTDGFIVTNYKSKLKTSKNLGDMKLEYEGDVYTFTDKNYTCVQCGEKIVGNVLYQVRDKIDLRIGKTVHYDRVVVNVGNDVKVVNAENVEESINEIKESYIYF